MRGDVVARIGPQTDRIERISLAVASAVVHALRMAGALNTPPTNGNVEVDKGRDAERVATQCDRVLSDWANDRRIRGKTGVDQDRRAIERVVQACGWKSFETAERAPYRKYLLEQRQAGMSSSRANKLTSLLSTIFKFINERREDANLEPVTNWAKGMSRMPNDDAGEGARPIDWDEKDAICRAALAEIRRNARSNQRERARQAWYRYAAYELGAYTSLRRGKLKGLRTENIVLGSTPHIRHLRKKGNKRVATTTPLHSDVLPIVRALMRRAVDGLLFPRGTFPSNRAMQADCKRAGIDSTGVGAHSLRKCFGGRCNEIGLDVGETAKLMGHSTLTHRIYQAYAHKTQARKIQNLGTGLDPRFGTNPPVPATRDTGNVEKLNRRLDSGNEIPDTDAVTSVQKPMISSPAQTPTASPVSMGSDVTIRAFAPGLAVAGCADEPRHANAKSASRAEGKPPAGLEPATCALQMRMSGIVIHARGTPSTLAQFAMHMARLLKGAVDVDSAAQ